MKRSIQRIVAAALTLVLLLMAGAALAEGAYVEATGNVYVRTGAGLSYSTLGTVDEGTRLTYLNESRNDERGVTWYKVSFDSTTGWISSRYSKVKNYDRKVTATSGQTYIRSAGSLSADKLDVLHEGESGTYLNEDHVDERGVVWYRISFDGIKGWVSSKYTTLSSAVELPTLKVTATSGQTNVRTEPNLNGKILGVLREDKSLTYLNQSSTDDRGVVWYKVSFEGGSGWVSSKYTTLK